MKISDLINKGDVEMNIVDDELKFCLEVTASWDKIVDSVKYY